MSLAYFFKSILKIFIGLVPALMNKTLFQLCRIPLNKLQPLPSRKVGKIREATPDIQIDSVDKRSLKVFFHLVISLRIINFRG